jgi:phosphoglycolate phosphatase
MVKYKLVIFDFDGTLADSFAWFVGVINSVAAKYQFKPVEEHELETLRGYGARQMIKHLEVPVWKIPFIANYMRQLMAQDRRGILCFEGVDQLLARLSQAGVTLALVTSNSYENVLNVLGADNLALMSYVECDAALFGKPARFRKILKQSGIRPDEALCIGDELRDIEAATQAQIPFGAVAWGYTKVEAFQAHAPAEVFVHVHDIAEKVI